MRLLPIVIGLVCISIPAAGIARPRPKLAVAPLAGDASDKVARAVVEALAEKDFVIVGPREVSREMARLGLADELDARSTRTLARKLGVVAVIDGKVSKAGRKRSLHLEVHRRGKPDVGFTIEFKALSSAGFRRGVRSEIKKKLEGAGAHEPADDDEARQPVAEADAPRPRTLADDDAPRPRKLSDDDAPRPRKLGDDDAPRPRKLADDEAAPPARKPTDDESARPSRKLADNDGDDRRRKSAVDSRKARRVAAAEDGDDTAIRKRKRHGVSDEAAAPPAARVGAGGSVAQRQLTYDTRSGFQQVPPRVLTTSGAGRVDGEIYPFALANPGSSLAGLGLAAAYDKTFGLAIKIPNTTVSAPINQSHYAIGARYRFGIGQASSVVLGLDYVGRKYVAERGGLMGAILDAPDVNYTAIAPGASVRVPVAASVVVFGGAGGLLMLEAGPIQTTASYGPATVYGVEAAAGVDLAITRQIGLRIAAEYSQIMIGFGAKGTMANNRDGDPTTQDVTGAADRSIGVAATLGVVY